MRGRKLVYRMGLLGGIFLMFFLVAEPGAAACSSSSGCAKCKSTQSGFSCGFVAQSAACTCELFIFGGTPACGEEGVCDYNPSLGSGGGGGGGGTAEPTCVRVPGAWCPAECPNCQTVYWY